MIKNVVFDFGQVMIRFEPSYMVGKYVTEADDAGLLQEVVFDRLYWDRLDAGTITDEEVLREVRARLPERLWDAAEKIYWNWVYNIPEIEGMSELVREIKERYGVRVFLLSNISLYFASHAHEIPSLALFEKRIFSSVCKRIKPTREMYAYLCEECGILPEETVFVDDNAANVKGAQDFGIEGYLFDGDASRLREYLQKRLEA